MSEWLPDNLQHNRRAITKIHSVWNGHSCVGVLSDLEVSVHPHLYLTPIGSVGSLHKVTLWQMATSPSRHCFLHIIPLYHIIHIIWVWLAVTSGFENLPLLISQVGYLDVWWIDEQYFLQSNGTVPWYNISPLIYLALNPIDPTPINLDQDISVIESVSPFLNSG